jgi:two-component system, response regulator
MARPIDILLVEDDPADAELALRALARSGMSPVVEHAPDGEAALSALNDGGLQPRLVLLDLKLPGMTGLDVLATLRAGASTRFLPVVVFTSSAEPRDLSGSYGSGANAFAQKPVNFDAFGDTLRRVCEFWLAVNRLPDFSQ